MKAHELTTTKTTSKKRVGRGISAGGGKTAGRGTKGQRARTGKKLRAGFEGGQNPLMMRIPKLKGFKSHHAAAQIVYTENLRLVGNKTIDNFSLAENGLISDPYHAVKIISRGEVDKAYSISVQNASASAIAAIEKAGGSFKKVETPKREGSESNKGNKRAAKKAATK